MAQSETMTLRLDPQTQAIEQGIDAADEGRVVDDDVVTAWLESWGSGRERGSS